MARAKFVARDDHKSPKRLGYKEAERIAHELCALAKASAAHYALFIGAVGDFLITPRYGRRFELWTERWPKSLCGVYAPDVAASVVIEDILGMDT